MEELVTNNSLSVAFRQYLDVIYDAAVKSRGYITNSNRTVKDFLGRPIYKGDSVAYPGRSGSSLWMNHGIVESVEQRGFDYKKEPRYIVKVKRDSGKVVTIWCTDRLVRL